MRLATLWLLSALLATCVGVKCYTRTLSTCHTNPALYYRIVARNDTPIDLRLGPTTNGRLHDWQVVWVSAKRWRSDAANRASG